MKFKETNQICSPLKISQSINAAFYKSKKFLGLFDVERRKKTEDGENVFFKDLAKNLLLTSKSGLWPTFYRMDVMKSNDMLYYYVILPKVD